MHRLSRRSFVTGCADDFGGKRRARLRSSPFASSIRSRPEGRSMPWPACWPSSCAASLSRSVIVDNRTGAGGRIGVKAVTQAEPDGTTLLFATGPLIALQPHIYPNLGYDPMSDLLPISHVMQTDLAFAVGLGRARARSRRAQGLGAIQCRASVLRLAGSRHVVPFCRPRARPAVWASTFATSPIAALEPRCPIFWAGASRCTSRRHPN